MAAMMRLRSFASIIAASLLLGSCANGPTAAQLDADNPVAPKTPPPFGMEDFFAVSHQPDPLRARLGRWLFYDTRLSSDGSISCATCHQPDFAFSEPRPVAVGIRGQSAAEARSSVP
jgi:cytochrome c peroxidase